MSEDQKKFFEQRYRGMSTEDLVEIYRKGNLTETASQVLELVLTERDVSPESRDALAETLKEESYEKQFEHLASLSDRLIGQIIDGFIALFFGVVVFFLFQLLFGAEGLAVLGAFSGWLLYNLMSDGFAGGQSFGKKITKIAVVYGVQRNPCTFWRSFLRNIPLLFLGIVDWLFIFGDARKRLGDHMAGTEVIKAYKKRPQSSRSQPTRIEPQFTSIQTVEGEGQQTGFPADAASPLLEATQSSQIQTSRVFVNKKIPGAIRFVIIVLALCIAGALGNVGRAFSSVYQESIQDSSTLNTIGIGYLFLVSAALYLIIALTGRHRSARGLTIAYFVVAFFLFAVLSSGAESIGLLPSPSSLDANGLVVRGLFALFRMIAFVASIICLVGSKGARLYFSRSTVKPSNTSV